MPAPLCFLDTETTGVHLGRQVWEVAMIRRDVDGVETERSFLVECDLSAADVRGLNVGRFYERHPLGRLLTGELTQEDFDEIREPSTERRSRSNRRTPRSRSSAMICWDKDGPAIRSRLAARPKLSSSATATK